MLYSHEELNDSNTWFIANNLELVAKFLNVDIRSLQLEAIDESEDKVLIVLMNGRNFQIDENLQVSEIF